MFREKRRYGQDPQNVHRSSDATFKAPLRWQREVERGERQGQGRLVFTCSWSDWFIREADAWRDDAWTIIRACPDLIFQVLTKRSERIADHLPADWGQGYPNVWLGVSVENQELADVRIPDLLGVPAAIRFLSCEPLLGPIDLTPWMPGRLIDRCRWFGNVESLESDGKVYPRRPTLGWIVAGGESGTEAGIEPTHPNWACSLRDQCVAAGVAFHWKQWGEWSPVSAPIGHDARNANETFLSPDGKHWTIRTGGPGREYMRRIGKKRAGRTLDGKTWDEFPVPLEATPS